MLKTLKDFFESQFPVDARTNTVSDTSSLELAAAVLMLEISLADSEIQDDERKVIEDALKKVFHLPETDVQTIIELAKQEVDHSVSLYEFTRLINDKMSLDERIRIVELLWQVAFADMTIDKYEEYFVRKIADLLYIPHQDYIKAKHRAAELSP